MEPSSGSANARPEGQRVVEAFVHCLWTVFRQECGVLIAYQHRFPVKSILDVDETTFAYLACREYLQLDDHQVIVRKEQWVGVRDGQAGKRCDVVLGDAIYARHWIELKLWKRGSDSFNRAEVWKDIDKLTNRVREGDEQVQTYSGIEKIRVPFDYTRHSVVLRATREPLSDGAWTLRRPRMVLEPEGVMVDEIGGWHLYLAVYALPRDAGSQAQPEPSGGDQLLP